jgi:antitoxin component YwqK of YwqJK toxin-antitoxin module
LKTWKGVIVKQYIYYDTLKHKVQFNEYHENQNLKSSGFKYPVAYKDTIYGFNEKTDSIDIPIYIDSILMMQGKWIYYHKNGQVESEGLYKDNKKKGCWKYYDERG